MTAIGDILVKVRVDLWSDLLEMLSDDGLDRLENTIALERMNRRRGA